jgi:hypothetical protein
MLRTALGPAIAGFLRDASVVENFGGRLWVDRLTRANGSSSTIRSTASPNAHAVLVPALEGFAPTPELREIAEAQALLGQLSNQGTLWKTSAAPPSSLASSSPAPWSATCFSGSCRRITFPTPRA